MKYLSEGCYKANPLPLVLMLDVAGFGIIALTAPGILAASAVLFAACIAQNTAFSLVSRSRNRDNQAYHALAAVGSNGVWLLTMKYMIDLGFAGWLVAPYIMGTVTGSLVGVKISMTIERLIGATSDGHLKPKA